MFINRENYENETSLSDNTSSFTRYDILFRSSAVTTRTWRYTMTQHNNHGMHYRHASRPDIEEKWKRKCRYYIKTTFVTHNMNKLDSGRYILNCMTIIIQKINPREKVTRKKNTYFEVVKKSYNLMGYAYNDTMFSHLYYRLL